MDSRFSPTTTKGPFSPFYVVFYYIAKTGIDGLTSLPNFAVLIQTDRNRASLNDASLTLHTVDFQDKIELAIPLSPSFILSGVSTFKFSSPFPLPPGIKGEHVSWLILVLYYSQESKEGGNIFLKRHVYYTGLLHTHRLK